ncbi:pyridoxamine 5'-phosphate oxidase family protein [Actinomadura sp. ATCC 31491]|uniref:Pyridoxamine 5'-phosphate oxidase family protein n=1 Tax=Actinomadura luzonensis TaxID=2805427 RepID=A0ABT0G8K0_9ACTN|nr:pyridoxamine 5'-phosphate oxidase family protein [Actinomadura luzonensis]MCK2220925.1 pyridoxamine 5'-phosphate oxidase family protein [Actinomadura luzonensis]
MSLSVPAREAFLAEAHIASLAVEAGEGRAPLTVPVWYDYVPGGDVRFLTDGESVKARLIAKAGRFSILVQRGSPTYRYVSVEGPLVRSSPSTLEDLTRISARYLPPDAVAGYVQGSDLHALVTFRMRPERWLSADLGALA